jgi:hypothetical protein
LSTLNVLIGYVSSLATKCLLLLDLEASTAQNKDKSCPYCWSADIALGRIIYTT